MLSPKAGKATWLRKFQTINKGGNVISIDRGEISFKVWLLVDNKFAETEEDIYCHLWKSRGRDSSEMKIMFANTSNLVLTVGVVMFGYHVYCLERKVWPIGEGLLLGPNQVGYITEWQYPEGAAKIRCREVPDFVKNRKIGSEYNRKGNNIVTIMVEPNCKQVAHRVFGTPVGIRIDPEQ